MRDDGGTGLLACGRTAPDPDRLRELIGGDWLDGQRSGGLPPTRPGQGGVVALGCPP
ncbi:hypothetical protein [Streptomyces yangpuensis]|uniref:hypothetical protein n=1 Tax=Streptomyces yangpuensis TaxID=1648182 RepID=UPI003661A5E8